MSARHAMPGSSKIDQPEAMAAKENNAMSTNHWHMFYEEKVINGALHWRPDEEGEWIPFSTQELTNKLIRCRVLFQRFAKGEVIIL
jgi:hypothetical protein